MEASISLKNVSKRLKDRYVISNVTFGVEKGSIFGLLGRSGAGKSSLMRLLASIWLNNGGKIYIKGQENLTGELRKNIGYLPQHDMHDPWLTGRENLTRRIMVLGMDPREMESKVEHLIVNFGLENYIDDYVVNYPAGVRRKLDIVQVLIGTPDVLLLDEPLINLDYVSSYQFMKEIIRLKKEYSTTVVVASNSVTSLTAVCDRWVVLDRGKVVFDGDWNKFEEARELPYACEFRVSSSASVPVMDRLKGEIVSCDIEGDYYRIKFRSPAGFKRLIEEVGLDRIVQLKAEMVDFEDFFRTIGTDDIF